jgi:hypothetical protein
MTLRIKVIKDHHIEPGALKIAGLIQAERGGGI